MSSSPIECVYDFQKLTKPLALTFLVVKGPNNLVGRHSLARLWPTEFKAFKESTCKNYGTTKSFNVINSNFSSRS